MKNKLGVEGLLSDDKRKIVQFDENGIIYRGINNEKKRILRYCVDGEMIKDDKKKCDRAFGLPDHNIVYLIELKGCDLKKASEQIYETIIALESKISGYVIQGRAICSRIPKPDIKSTQVVRLEREIAKRKGSFIKSSRFFEENI